MSSSIVKINAEMSLSSLFSFPERSSVGTTVSGTPMNRNKNLGNSNLRNASSHAENKLEKDVMRKLFE